MFNDSKNTETIAQVKEYILNNIVSETWKDNQKIPSLGFFAIKFNLPRKVIKKIIDKFQQINIIYSKERIGYFVKTNSLRMIFKRETNADGCNDSSILQADITPYFNLEEINCINFPEATSKYKIPSEKNSYIKMYFNNNNPQIICKVSFTIINKKLIPHAEWTNEKPFYKVLLDHKIIPTTKISHTKFVDQCPDEIQKILQLSHQWGVIIKYIILLNKQGDIISFSKLFINHKYFSNFTQTHFN